jgi:hypothetical protein
MKKTGQFADYLVRGSVRVTAQFLQSLQPRAQGCGLPSMNWETFQRDHHRPHLLVVSMEARKASKPPAEKADLERLAVSLGAAGNYAFKVEDTTVYAAFEDDADAERFAEVFRPEQISRESEWASKALARMDFFRDRSEPFGAISIYR